MEPLQGPLPGHHPAFCERKLFCVGGAHPPARAPDAVLSSLRGRFFPIARSRSPIPTCSGHPDVLVISTSGSGWPAPRVSGRPNVGGLLGGRRARASCKPPTCPRCTARASTRCTRSQGPPRARSASHTASRCASSSSPAVRGRSRRLLKRLHRPPEEPLRRHPGCGGGVQAGADRRVATFNFHTVPRRATLFAPDHDTASALHRLAWSRGTGSSHQAGGGGSGKPDITRRCASRGLHKSFGKLEGLRGIPTSTSPSTRSSA